MTSDPVAAAYAAASNIAPVVLRHGALPFIVAALTGATLGLIEQANRLRSRFTFENRAGLWWAARLTLELAVGVGALAILREAEPRVANHWWAWFSAGAAGAAVMRLRVLDLEQRPIGIATVYEPIRGFIEDQIDRRSAECLTTWINYEVLPRLGRLHADPGDLVSYVMDFVNARYRVSPRDAQREIDWLTNARDGAQPDDVKRELIVRHIATELGGYRLLERYLRENEGATGHPPNP